MIFYASLATRVPALPDDQQLDFDTLATQAGLRVRVGDSISTAPPIDPSSTFVYESIEETHRALGSDGKGFAYSRNANPTVRLLEDAVARLEGAEDCVAFGSGMAAIACTLQALQLSPGDTVLAASDLYGVTRTLLTQLAQYEINVGFVDVFAPDRVDTALRETRASALLVETVTNPLLRVPDVAAIVDRAKRRNAAVVIDNTFASPYLYRPIAAGADLVLHSATKYLGGHGDATAGVVSGSASLARRIRDVRTVQGAVLSPFEAWLMLRGIRTLHVRLERQCATAASLAAWLTEQQWVADVYYPGLADHPHRENAQRQFGGRFGAMVSFDVRGGEAEALRFIDGLRVITAGTSLGDVESLALYPPLSSHRGLSTDQQRAAGIGPGLVRLSVGLESLSDLRNDLAQAARQGALPGAD